MAAPRNSEAEMLNRDRDRLLMDNAIAIGETSGTVTMRGVLTT